MSEEIIQDQQVTRCPDCETEYPKAIEGTYRCPVCYCKFKVEADSSMKIIPFFDEISLEPFLVMLTVLGLVIVFAIGDAWYGMGDRIRIFLLFVLAIFAIYKLTELGCRRYRKLDRFFRRMSRFGLDESGDGGLIKIKERDNA